jgi:hypothetical protein
MNIRSLRSISLALVSLVVLQASAFADVIEGRVADSDSRSLDVSVYDPQGRPYPNNLRLGIDSRTRVRGAESLDDLRQGDPISADVRQLESGNWHADTVTLFQDMDARPATQNPPPTMRDVLGNPMVKGALLGAATGALASGASGGKAGKGALVGAGVGAIGGLLFGGGGDQDSSN